MKLNRVTTMPWPELRVLVPWSKLYKTTKWVVLKLTEVVWVLLKLFLVSPRLVRYTEPGKYEEITRETYENVR